MAKVNKNTGCSLNVRELFKATPQQLVNGLRNDLVIVFEDGVEDHMTYKEITLLRFIMELYIVVPNVPIVSRHNFKNYYSNGILTSKTINKSFQCILEDTVEIYVKPNLDRSILPKLYETMYRINNDIYNDLVYDVIEHVNSISIFDFLDIQMDETLLNSMRDVHKKKDVTSVNKTYDILDNLLKNKPEIKDNIITRGYLSGTVNANQVKQLLASRGYVTEIDSKIFKYPIASSFTLGMSNIYDLSIESRAGAKALHLSNKAVQESEYFARELQLITMIVEKLVDTDCGNKDYMPWLVRSKDLAGKSDIGNLLGKYYLNEETGKEEPITSKHTHLEGKIIKLRTSLNCKLKDPTHVCIKCFGELSYTVPQHSNIGHFSATAVTERLTQSILSTKHLATSATGGEATLDSNAQKFFTIKSNDYYFKANILDKAKTKYTLVIDQYSAFGVKDLNANVDVYKLNPSRVSKIQEIAILSRDDKGVVNMFPITIKDGNRCGNFTYEFLEYIVENSYTLDEQDRYNIDLSGWDHKRPFITMPELEYNFLTLSRNIKSIFKNIEVKKGDKSTDTPESLLQKVFDMVNTKLDINIALLEIIVYAFTVYSIRDDDYRLGRNSPDRQLMKSKNLIANRSLGAGYDWEFVVNMILSPRSFYGNNNVSHPLDVMIKPNDVLKPQQA